MPPCCIFLFLCPLPPSPHPSDHRAAHILISVEWLPLSFSLLLGKGNKDITTFSSIVLEHLSPFLFSRMFSYSSPYLLVCSFSTYYQSFLRLRVTSVVKSHQICQPLLKGSITVWDSCCQAGDEYGAKAAFLPLRPEISADTC